MAELRKAEQEAQKMLAVYESARLATNSAASEQPQRFPFLTDIILPPLSLPITHPNHPEYTEQPQVTNETADTPPVLPRAPPLAWQEFESEASMLTALHDLRRQWTELEPRMTKFAKNMAEKDPISGLPRYGAKTTLRVQQLQILYRALHLGIEHAFGEAEQASESSSATNDNNPHNSLVAQLVRCIHDQETAARQAEELALRQELEQAERQRAQEERDREQAEAQRRAQEEERRTQEAELARRAEEQRQAQRQAQQRVRDAEQAWLDSIPKGPRGVQQQLNVLIESTVNDPQAQTTALQALQTLFTQIVKHPEEINFRRIRRDHARFQQDIGRHPGGREILIAAGFRLVTIDDVPCFYSKEPDLESDMDGWSAWFENLKAVHEVVMEQKV